MENKAIKEMFDKKINKNQIYDKVIQNNHKKKLVILKYAFCPLIILCIISLCFSNDNIYLAIAKQVFQKEINKKGLGMSLKTFFPVFLFAICLDI